MMKPRNYNSVDLELEYSESDTSSGFNELENYPEISVDLSDEIITNKIIDYEKNGTENITNEADMKPVRQIIRGSVIYE